MYRVRKQALTGKLILQHDMAIGPDGYVSWTDAQAMPGEYAMVPIQTYLALIEERGKHAARIERYDRRAKAQKDARAAKQQPQEQQ